MLAVQRGLDASSHVFVVGRDAHLYHLTESRPSGAAPFWQSEVVALPTLTTVEAFPSYLIQLTLQDTRTGEVMGDGLVRLWATDALAITVNGQHYLVGLATPAVCQPSPAGWLLVGYRAESLDSPALLVNTGFMDPDARLIVDPGMGVQETLAAITPDQWLGGVTRCGASSPLFQLPAPYNTAEQARAWTAFIGRCLAPSPSADGPLPPYLAHQGRPLADGGHWRLTLAPALSFQELPPGGPVASAGLLGALEDIISWLTGSSSRTQPQLDSVELDGPIGTFISSLGVTQAGVSWVAVLAGIVAAVFDNLTLGPWQGQPVQDLLDLLA